MANYPTSVFSPSARSNGQTIDASHVNGLQDEVTAIETALEGTITHSLNVSGNSTLAKLSAGASTLASLSVSGVSTLASLQVTGGSTHTGTFNQVGGSTFTGDINVGGNLTVFGSTFDNAGMSRLAGGIKLCSRPTTVVLTSGDNNNLVLASSVTHVRVQTDNANSTITGIQTAGGESRVVVLMNVGPTGILGFKNSSVSNSSNQLSIGNDTSCIVGRSATFIYDAHAAVWIMAGKS